MAVKVTGFIQPNSGQYAIEAQHVAFSYGDNQAKTVQAAIEELVTAIANLPSGGGSVSGDASTLIYEGQQTIKQKIEALEAGLGTTAQNITYSYTNGNNETVTTNVKAVLDDLRSALSQVSGISDSLTAAQGYANQARVAQADVETKNTEINNKYAIITNLANQTANTAQDFSGRLNELEQIAQDLSTTFDYDAQFQVISRSAYNAMTEIERGATVFLIYDDTVNNNTYYQLTINRGDSFVNPGVFIGGGIYTSGTTVQIAAIPNSGYEFSHWGNTQEDSGDHQNPKNITMTGETIITGWFKEITPNS